MTGTPVSDLQSFFPSIFYSFFYIFIVVEIHFLIQQVLKIVAAPPSFTVFCISNQEEAQLKYDMAVFQNSPPPLLSQSSLWSEVFASLVPIECHSNLLQLGASLIQMIGPRSGDNCPLGAQTLLTSPSPPHPSLCSFAPQTGARSCRALLKLQKHVVLFSLQPDTHLEGLCVASLVSCSSFLRQIENGAAVSKGRSLFY